ncbi:MAG: response regulator transcription factor [Acidobacteriia bacterium]|nr:response regulator transcription factor [Terriglobia bacterium]
MTRTSILLADDHTLVLEGLKKLLAPEFELVGMVKDGRALLAAAGKLMPDVVLLDISMPLLNGLEAARQLKKMLPDVQIVFLTMHSEKVYVTEAFRAGASGYLLKSSAASELVFAIREVVKGRFYVTPLVAKDVLCTLLDQPRRPHPAARPGSAENLTSRQREVLQLVAEGCANKEIAEIMKISIKTVEFHKSAIMQKLGLHGTAELTKYALKHGIAGETE